MDFTILAEHLCLRGRVVHTRVEPSSIGCSFSIPKNDIDTEDFAFFEEWFHIRREGDVFAMFEEFVQFLFKLNEMSWEEGREGCFGIQYKLDLLFRRLSQQSYQPLHCLLLVGIEMYGANLCSSDDNLPCHCGFYW